MMYKKILIATDDRSWRAALWRMVSNWRKNSRSPLLLRP
jgi:hypothetical protein